MKLSISKSLLIGIIVAVVVGIAITALIFYLVKNKKEDSSKETQTSEFQEDEGEKYIVALGDSITQANGLSTELGSDNPDYSFATGTKIDSVYMYLKDKGEGLKPLNLAISGAATKDVIVDQLPKIPTDLPIKYITSLIGGNDMMGGFTLDEFENNLSEIISKIKNKDTTILIASVPNLVKMQTAEYPICAESKVTVSHLEALSQVYIQAFNKIIREIAEDNDLIFVDLYPHLGTPEVSEHDCFHPNISGQEKIADQFIEKI